MDGTLPGPVVLEKGCSAERYGPGWGFALWSADLMMFFLSLFVAGALFESPSTSRSELLAGELAIAVVWTIVFALVGMYRRSFATSPKDELYYTAAGVFVGAAPQLLLNAAAPWHKALVATQLLSMVVAIGAVGGMRVVLRSVRERQPCTQATGSTAARRWSPADRCIKRMFDVLASLLGLAVFAPLMLIAALAVLWETGRPVFFRQQRVGRKCKPFDIFKFRSMRADADRGCAAQWARPGDPRITKVGAMLRRASLDELPQLLNVLRGEMSMVGPRPEMTSYAEQFRRQLADYDERHLVAPGITGWAQVTLPRILEPDDAPEVLACDLFYVNNWSPFLDVAIILKTAVELLFHDVA